jgi:hypothetical protein
MTIHEHLYSSEITRRDSSFHNDLIDAAGLTTENHAVHTIERIESILDVHDDATSEQLGLALAADAGPAVVRDFDAQVFRRFEYGLARGNLLRFIRSRERNRGRPEGSTG